MQPNHQQQTEIPARSPLQQPTLIYLGLALLVFAIFWPVMGYNFVLIADAERLMNPHVESGLSIPNIAWAFSNFSAGSWQPLTWLSHQLDFSIFGKNAGGHHFTSLLFHIANTLLLFAFLQKITGLKWRSAIVTILFALHPLQVEAAAWIAQRQIVLATFFSLLALLCYSTQFRAAENRGKFWSALTIVFFCCACMSSPVALVLPLIFLLLDFWPLRRFETQPARSLFAEKIPLFAISGAFLILTLVAQKNLNPIWPTTFFERLKIAFTSATFFPGRILWPNSLAVLYPPEVRWWEWVCADLVVAIVTWAFWFLRKSRPYLIAGWFWFLAALLPAICFLIFGRELFGDRLGYFSVIGIFILLTWFVAESFVKLPFGRALRSGAAVFVILFCVVASSIQLRYWRNSEALLSHTVDATKNNYFAHNLLGSIYASQKRAEEAAGQFAAAVQAQPGFLAAYNNLGQSLIQLGKTNEAVSVLQAALKLNPNDPQANANLGIALSMAGKLDEAKTHLEEAVQQQPNNAKMHFNLGMALMAQEKISDAIPELQEALRLDPTNVNTRVNLGFALARADETEEAAAEFLEAIRQEPDNAQAHYFLGLSEVVRGRPELAMPRFREAIRLAPNWPVPYNDLAWILATHPDPAVRNGTEAVKLAEKACELADWKEAPYIGTLDAAYAETGNFEKAISTAQKTIERAEATNQPEIANAAQKRLQLYREKKPFRQELAH